MMTNAARILQRMGIRFELRDYEVDEVDLSAGSVAAKVGLPLDQVWKTPRRFLRTDDDAVSSATLTTECVPSSHCAINLVTRHPIFRL